MSDFQNCSQEVSDKNPTNNDNNSFCDISEFTPNGDVFYVSSSNDSTTEDTLNKNLSNQIFKKVRDNYHVLLRATRCTNLHLWLATG